MTAVRALEHAVLATSVSYSTTRQPIAHVSCSCSLGSVLPRNARLSVAACPATSATTSTTQSRGRFCRAVSARAAADDAANSGDSDTSDAAPVPALSMKKASLKARQQTYQQTPEETDQLDTILDLKLQSAFDVPPRHYEIIFLVHEGCTDVTPAIIEKITEMVKDARGTVWRVNDWGMRRLAYRIQKTWQAQYILVNIEVPSDKIAAIEKVLLQDERVIRHLVTKQDKAERKDYPAPVMYNAVGSGGDESDDDEDEEDEDEDDEEDWEDEDEDEEDEEEEGEESEGKRLPAEVTSRKA
ncbi:unnamed protein product [Closterium sp. NIES-53]